MNKYTALISTLATLVALSGCEDPNKSTQKTYESRPSMLVKKQATYAMRGADQSWPGTANADLGLEKENTRKNYYLIFDGSGSMADTRCGGGDSRINVAKRAVNEFIRTVPEDSNMGLAAFDNSGQFERSKLKEFDKNELTRIIGRLKSGGGTPLGDAISQAYQQLTLQGQKQQGYGEYNLIVITDGAANDTKKMNDAVRLIVNNSPINIHTIGFCLGSDHALNQPSIVNYKSANNAAELVSGLKSVLAEAGDFSADTFED
ncbi:MAG: hypothetical protein COA42_07680 [Alteromonadaceae bacterium]|nr:MAG: hypothetical protein COA42_07680 [Alteromonadaceae bacterium]